VVQFLQSYWSIVQADPLPFIVLAAICLSMGFGAGLWMRKEQITILKTRLEFGQGKLGPKIEQSDIDYPKSGFYGENLLSPMTSDLKPRQEYSLAVNINTRKKIRVRFSHTNQYSFGLWYYGTGSLKGWLARTYQKDAREQCLRLAGLLRVMACLSWTKIPTSPLNFMQPMRRCHFFQRRSYVGRQPLSPRRLG